MKFLEKYQLLDNFFSTIGELYNKIDNALSKIKNNHMMNSEQVSKDKTQKSSYKSQFFNNV